MNDSEHNAYEQDTPDDFNKIALSDLPPDRRSHYLLLKLIALSQRSRAVLAVFRQQPALFLRRIPYALHLHTKQAVISLALCVFILALFVGSIPALHTRFVGLFQPPRATSVSRSEDSLTRSYSSVIIVGGATVVVAIDSSGSLPHSCPRTGVMQRFDASLKLSGLGGGPVWATGFTGRHMATLTHLLPSNVWQATSANDLALQWYGTLTFFVKKSFSGTLVLQGSNQVSKESIQYGLVTRTDIAPSLTISPQNPQGDHFKSRGQWESLAVNVYIPTSGCYALHASWHTSSWTIYFAAGS